MPHRLSSNISHYYHYAGGVLCCQGWYWILFGSRLRAKGMKFKFVTNSSKESTSHLTNRLITLGVPVPTSSHIFTSLSAAKQYINTRNLRPMLFLQPNALDDFAGLLICIHRMLYWKVHLYSCMYVCVGYKDPWKYHSSAIVYFLVCVVFCYYFLYFYALDVITTEPNSVVVGLAPSMFQYDKLTEAFNLLKHGSELIAINKSRYFQSNDGLVLGAGNNAYTPNFLCCWTYRYCFSFSSDKLDIINIYNPVHHGVPDPDKKS